MSYRLNMCEGPILGKIVQFVIPLYFTLLLKLLFNAADLVIVGRYADHSALAAVGSTASLVNLLVNFFFGLSIGTNVITATAFGAKDDRLLSTTVHTSMCMALVGGVIVAGLGQVVARPLLELMSTPADIVDQAALYVRIYFLGMPVMYIYDFGSAAMRGIGDTRRPLMYLLISGVINVPLNVFFVTRCGMDVDGVAWATVLSQIVAAVLVWRALSGNRDASRLEWRRLGIDWRVLKRMLVIGLPAAAQSSFFALSNMLIQSTLNTFGTMAVAGNAVMNNLMSLYYACPFAFHQTTISFVGQNYGARQRSRICRGVMVCLVLAMFFAGLLGAIGLVWGPGILSVYNSHPEVIHWGMVRMNTVMWCYAFVGGMDVMSGALRGLGRSLTSACVVLVSVCVLRVVWIYGVFPLKPTMEVLLLSYPASWLLSMAFTSLFLWLVCRGIFRRWRAEEGVSETSGRDLSEAF